MKTFRTKLSLILMGLVGISMLAAGLTMAQLFKNSHIRALEENMEREISLLEDTFRFVPVQGNASAEAYYTEQAKALEKMTDSRVTFITLDGKVVGDSEMDPEGMDNHAHRKEIESAEGGGAGSAIRYSHTVGENMLYVARRVTSADGFDGYIRLSMSLGAVEKGLTQGWLLMAGGLLILFLVAGFVSYRIAAGMTRPLEQITRVAHRISKLDYNARVKLARRDEIGQLGEAINGMADSLQQQLKRIHDNEDLLQSVLANMTGGIVMVDASGAIALINREAERILHVKGYQLLGRPYRDIKRNYEFTKFVEEGISRQENVQEERNVYDPEEKILLFDSVPMFEDNGKYRGMLFLLRDVTDIRRLERMRSEFVANVSHELKTPIAAVKGFAETLLAGGVKDEETARSFLQIIYDEGDRLNRLIGDILDLSKIESKLVPLEYAPVNLKELFDSIYEVLLPAAKKKSIAMAHDIPDHLFMEGDEDRLRQIFMNLLSNAISYTQEGGRVRVDVAILGEGGEDEKVRIVVSDTGIGIPKKDLPRIFERFYRVDKARSRSSGGTGLGLSIVKHLVDLHHGTISVESKVGEGSSFIVELPFMHTLDEG
ncbi:MAG: ATP-binding protein [Paenibacillus macerans]|uniref:two-component system histidine kinase PnpS n=1 Tax=Paenibacillus TaxID=44249 RepID=UPI000EBF5AED|nr:ATP-binding protein [Paenibacillus macerans]MBS5914121.1 HAMP domain-containing protein [Paenibacillus macerans]MDU7476927.1 ATP-binding protein [Paenibacillus macerans]GBK60417.1 PAS domain-containing sensor histidine kinase [Paenibacillus macerans]GBK66716.1 PAS domain-containing sensor histidine kinase [Paenibacillus macerans]GIP09006.1 PAS domain-containing sensor histidine kinase [Paenibacillus macerans]